MAKMYLPICGSMQIDSWPIRHVQIITLSNHDHLLLPDIVFLEDILRHLLRRGSVILLHPWWDQRRNARDRHQSMIIHNPRPVLNRAADGSVSGEGVIQSRPKYGQQAKRQALGLILPVLPAIASDIAASGFITACRQRISQPEHIAQGVDPRVGNVSGTVEIDFIDLADCKKGHNIQRKSAQSIAAVAVSKMRKEC